MELLMVLLSGCLFVHSANHVAHDVKEIFMQGHSEDAQLDDLLNMLRQETTTGRPQIVTHSPQPYFAPGLSQTNNTVQLGADVTLHCFVKDLSDETKVSWLRRHGDKLNLLSVGQEKYSSEPRYSPGYRAPHDWQLRLSGTKQSDQGYYECQVSSHPPIIQRFYLAVVVPELEILDERGLPIRVHKFYNSGSTIELKCIVRQVPPLSTAGSGQRLISWRRGDRLLGSRDLRGGISVKTDALEDGLMSRLFIANGNQRDSGNYSCSLADIAHSSVMVVVLNGESPAAMHVGRAAALTPSPLFLCIFGYLTFFYSRFTFIIKGIIR